MKIVLLILISLCTICSVYSISFVKRFNNKNLYKIIKHEKNLLRFRQTTEDWFEQKLDNFHPTDSRTWFQRYFVESRYSKDGGPVFLSIGGEGPASPVWMSNGHWIDMAKKTGAFCFQLEHRYYGLSQPTKDVSKENLIYLSSEQALEDLSNFISSMKEKYNLQNRKWIVFGGSYPGSLALWSRLKYPHLIDGAVSASAPLTAMLDFSGYNVVVNNSISTLGSSECAKRIESASEYLLTLFNNNDLDTIRNLFNGHTCDVVTSFDRQFFQQSLADTIAEVVQYNRDNKAFESHGVQSMNISELCGKYFTGGDVNDGLNNLKHFRDTVVEITARNNQPCLDISYKKYLSEMTNSSWDAAPSMRQWMYQTCTEFGWFQTAYDTGLFRDFPLDFFLQQCQIMYGVDGKQIRKNIARTNTVYGGLKISGVLTNATLYNGLIDPWSSISYLDAGTKLPVQVVQDTAHCAIMYPSSQKDSSGLVRARKEVEDLVYKWLGV